MGLRQPENQNVGIAWKNRPPVGLGSKRSSKPVPARIDRSAAAAAAAEVANGSAAASTGLLAAACSGDLPAGDAAAARDFSGDVCSASGGNSKETLDMSSTSSVRVLSSMEPNRVFVSGGHLQDT